MGAEMLHPSHQIAEFRFTGSLEFAEKGPSSIS